MKLTEKCVVLPYDRYQMLLQSQQHIQQEQKNDKLDDNSLNETPSGKEDSKPIQSTPDISTDAKKRKLSK